MENPISPAMRVIIKAINVKNGSPLALAQDGTKCANYIRYMFFGHSRIVDNLARTYSMMAREETVPFPACFT